MSDELSYKLFHTNREAILSPSAIYLFGFAWVCLVYCCSIGQYALNKSDAVLHLFGSRFHGADGEADFQGFANPKKRRQLLLNMETTLAYIITTELLNPGH